jgi:hypothetical protein
VDFEQRIPEELDGAIVVWTNESVKSKYVRAEAREGLLRSRLVPVLLEDVNPPLSFRSLHAARLVGWPAMEMADEMAVLTSAVAKLLPANARPVG